MKQLVDFLNSKWSILLSFIPVVNILYVLFRFLTIHDKAYDISIWSLLVVAPFCLLYRFIPDTYYWLITHLILSVIVFLITKKCRGAYRWPVRIQFRWEMAFIGGLLLFFICTRSSFSQDISEFRIVEDFTNNAVAAITDDDEDKWQSVIHPEYGTELILDDIQEEIATNGIRLEDYRLGEVVLAQYDVDDGTAVSVTIDLNCKDDTFCVKGIFQTSENGSGFIEFEIVKPAVSDWEEPVRNYHVPRPKKEPTKAP